mmetsp:Transcript_11521/g.20415  ORF Transcript_11521/g.20415 Transcript_11521/m.20415 type:complete len:87 (-) Transcript_11521:206-466(-)
MLELVHVLSQEVGIEAIFSDLPATTTFYANCVPRLTSTTPGNSEDSEPMPFAIGVVVVVFVVLAGALLLYMKPKNEAEGSDGAQVV